MRRIVVPVWGVVFLMIAVFAVAPARAECDSTPPQLTGFSFTPDVIDVSTGAVGVTCTMTVTDMPAGVGEVACSFTSPLFFQVQSCTTATPVSGSSQNGTFECVVTIPRYADAGTWTAGVTLADAVGNEQALASFDLTGLGFPTTLSVSSVPSDFGAPVLTDFDFTPTSVNVGSGPATVTCDMTFIDSPAGVTEASCQFQAPDTFLIESCTATAPSSGTPTNGTFSCDIEIPEFADDGTWSARVIATDSVGNVFFADATLLGIQGFPTDLSVTSANEDVTPPLLTDFSTSTNSVDVTSSSATVTCTMDVSDSPAGVLFAGCSFLSPASAQQQACFSLTPSSGTSQNGTYACTAVIPAFSEEGAWDVSVFVQDVVGNAAALIAADLAGLGFPSVLNVTCGGTTDPIVDWTTNTTLSWTAIADAIRYNVYRGLISDLGTTYGTCQNARDPLLTDTSFVETDTPPVGDGYQFLVSVTTTAGEEGLGTGAAGLRTVASPCP